MNIVEFLEARLAEDEEYARHRQVEAESEAAEGRITVYRWVSGSGVPGKLYDDPVLNLAEPRRWLAEVAAKRAGLVKLKEIHDFDLGWEYIDTPELAWAVLVAMAGVYGDHRDFDPEWAS